MSEIKFGVQTYSWQMSYEKFRGEIRHIADIGKTAGFQGMEAEICMLDRLFPDVEHVRAIMQEYDLKFAALALPLNWLNEVETQDERETADLAIRFAREMGDCRLILCHLPQKDRKALRQRQENQIKCIREVAGRAAASGVETAFHPNSSPGSAFRTRDDYALLMDGIDNSCLGFAPDAGHIAHGDMDPLEIIRDYRSKVRHVHFKDMSSDGVWQSMGKGSIDFPGIVAFLRDTDYDGWIMVEEESARAGEDPDGVTMDNGNYIRALKK